MTQDWTHYYLPLYDQILPNGGIINHHISSEMGGVLKRVMVTICLEGLTYTDPFYGPFTLEKTQFTFELWKDESMDLQRFEDIQGKSYRYDKDPLRGYFASSIDVIFTQLQFGKIQNNQIPLSFKFSFTSLESGVGECGGTLAEHLQHSRELQVQLKIGELIFANTMNENLTPENLNKYFEAQIQNLWVSCFLGTC